MTRPYEVFFQSGMYIFFLQYCPGLSSELSTGIPLKLKIQKSLSTSIINRLIWNLAARMFCVMHADAVPRACGISNYRQPSYFQHDKVQLFSFDAIPTISSANTKTFQEHTRRYFRLLLMDSRHKIARAGLAPLFTWYVTKMQTNGCQSVMVVDEKCCDVLMVLMS